MGKSKLFHPILLSVAAEKTLIFVSMLLLAGIVSSSIIGWQYFQKTRSDWQSELTNIESQLKDSLSQVESTKTELDSLKNIDQKKRNDELEKEIKNIQLSYERLSKLYESLTDLKEGAGKKSPLDTLFAKTVSLLGKRQYDEAVTNIKDLEKKIAEENARIAALSATSTVNVPVNNSAPGSGYRKQKVQIDAGEFVVDIIAADLNSTRVIVDTASDSTCTNDCPVLPLATYAARSGAFAGINGTYFCPETYPDCQSKKNSFDMLVMNKNKVYFNSDNNVYSTVPIAIFSGNSARYLHKTQDWGRDTGVDAVIANHPALLINGEVLASSGDPKLTSRGYRGFLGNNGSMVYMGFVRNASLNESAKVLKALGMNSALNLDSGGSTALWNGGYKLGPGRNIPNAVLFVRK
jgi:hypothetical protein